MGLTKYLDMDEASAYLKIEKGTLYQWVSKGIVPYYKPTKGKTLFKQSELDDWIAKSKVEVDNGME